LLLELGCGLLLWLLLLWLELGCLLGGWLGSLLRGLLLLLTTPLVHVPQSSLHNVIDGTRGLVINFIWHYPEGGGDVPAKVYALLHLGLNMGLTLACQVV
jgi:hypothetical protein